MPFYFSVFLSSRRFNTLIIIYLPQVPKVLLLTDIPHPLKRDPEPTESKERSTTTKATTIKEGHFLASFYAISSSVFVSTRSTHSISTATSTFSDRSPSISQSQIYVIHLH